MAELRELYYVATSPDGVDISAEGAELRESYYAATSPGGEAMKPIICYLLPSRLTGPSFTGAYQEKKIPVAFL